MIIVLSDDFFILLGTYTDRLRLDGGMPIDLR